MEKSRATKMSFSNDEFEECDAFPEDIEYIFRLDVKTGELTHKVCIGSLFFFTGLLLSDHLINDLHTN